MAESDLQALYITLRLAAVTTLILLLIGTPLAWWLAHTRNRLAPVFEALVALPLILPPTVVGFYLLVALAPEGPVGSLVAALGGPRLAFSFTGMVIGSVLYSLPFVVQPLQNAFRALGSRPLEAAATLRAGPLDRFLSVALPLARGGFLTAMVLGFAHTVGEFGVVLMIGGNIPGETQVLSIAIYDHVEALDYASAHRLSAGLLVLSFVVLLLLQWAGRTERRAS
ncbi:MAG: molybdate ABC transporter permease subunit [Gammaproteobacteria bacterium]|nr:MAG: molybdate ABC transporter permease subunit [Gammaproteobacteria bacterium]